MTQGQVAVVDARDFERLSAYKWCAMRAGGCWYAVRVTARPNRRTILMHREVLPGVAVVDHKNHNGLDNRLRNLRECDTRTNLYNARRRSDNTSGFRGVSWSAKERKWIARIKLPSRRIRLGCFSDIEQAASAYAAAARKHFGKFACVNKAA